ncbi:hypothetical protein J5226_17455 [Lysobacter sp. K5869]|uniref:hypothetical protein n=1 Tax=Lysobacter sp. K5869 TaxID=2820808 RepID=UPI001C0605E4|nr:hypothetical protein [Lysobacter sp. K5869]QWP75396.1 hypothetical protein J5226_17455 [Lysobacter sp. K5869]
MTIEYPNVDHEPVFAQAWNAPGHTRFEIPPVDVNRILAERYELERPLQLTRTQLWEMETRKARRPDLYIPYVVEPGSAAVWDDRGERDRVERFVRKSRQRLWLQPERHELILEQTRVDHAQQKVTFIGASEYPGPDGATLTAGASQPIFHVIHGVGGDEARPLNLWSVVFLTPEQDSRLLAPFVRMSHEGWLPGYVEIYIREDLKIGLSRRS